MDTDAQIRNVTSELRLLFEVGQTMDVSTALNDQLENVLAMMARYTGMMRGAISLANSDGSELISEVAYGLAEHQRRLGRYKLGEGITGTVLLTGEPVIVPKISQEPLFLNRTSARDLQKEEISFICVPIKIDGQTVGALSADRLFADSINLQEDMRLMQILARLLGKAVRARREILFQHEAVVQENRRLQQLLHGKLEAAENLVGKSAAMRNILAQIAQVAASNATVLIRGESGTGKELAAGIIHANSPRAGRPFVRVNCAALPDSLVESELFGHERGAFTGAAGMRRGRFEMADGGTLFLDEIGDMTLLTQAKLLRTLQEREFERVGGTETRKVDVRVISATNRDLEKMVQEGIFRHDLYYRLSVVPLLLPPLRERREDIMALTTHFVDKYSRENHKRIAHISSHAADMLMEHNWPGNIRELENAMERAVLMCGVDGVIDLNHLPPSMRKSGDNPMGLLDALDKLEEHMICTALALADGNMAKAAAELRISERIMGLRMKKHALNYRDFRQQKSTSKKVVKPL